MRLTDICQIYNCRSRSSNITRFTWYGFNNSGKVFLEVKPDSPDTVRKIFKNHFMLIEFYFKMLSVRGDGHISKTLAHNLLFSLKQE